ncbi:hypothetical protein ABEB36_005439 [Hypothenemus hampei]|uniref:Cathepsin O n=1 Tax=Hypothenemus hampei TaxID=57062 RepID=A0ABD1EY82_HYPHA
MPSRLYSVSFKTYLEICFYIALMLFVVPMRKENSHQYKQKFLNYMRDFNKSYSDDVMFNKRLAAFQRSLEDIDRLNLNRTNTSALYGLTKFSDLTPEEFLQLQNNKQNTALKNDNLISKRSTSTYWPGIPKQIDWRDKHVVSKVKHQKDCGACWAFAVIETIESMKAIKTNQLRELSVQQMIDCSDYNNGCFGGDTCLLLRWLKDFNVSIVSETDYPVKLIDQNCQKTNKLSYKVQIDNYACDNFLGREDVVLKLLAINGPVAVGISAQTWQHYVGGVIQFHCDGKLSHAVQIVGYNLNAVVPYYIVRNSWGNDFGDNGYLYIAIGSNVCGIAYEVAAVTVL